MKLWSDGIRYHLECGTRQVGKPWLLLMHGFMGSGEAFSHLIEPLSEFCNPLTADLAGHGRSEGTNDPERYRSDRQVRDLLSILARLRPESPFLGEELQKDKQSGTERESETEKRQRNASGKPGGMEPSEIDADTAKSGTAMEAESAGIDRGAEKPGIDRGTGNSGTDIEAESSGIDRDAEKPEIDAQDDMTGIDVRAEPLLLYGYSMGGRLALQLALARPRLFDGLLLESATPGEPQPQRRQERQLLDEKRARRIEDDFETFLEEWERLPLFAAGRPGPLRDRYREMMRSQNPARLAASLRGFGTGVMPPLNSRLHELHMPVLLLSGEEDRKFCTIHRQMESLIPDATLSILPGAAHRPHLDSPDELIRRIKTFIQIRWP